MNLTDSTKVALLDNGISDVYTINTIIVKFPFQVGSAFTLPLGKKRAMIIAKRYLRDDQWVHEF
jgi:hypothetical protein